MAGRLDGWTAPEYSGECKGTHFRGGFLFRGRQNHFVFFGGIIHLEKRLKCEDMGNGEGSGKCTG